MTISRWMARCWKPASHKSFRPKDEDDNDSGGGGDFHGESRSNATHASTTDPDARLMRKGAGKEAKLCYLANTLMENRNGLIVGVDVRHADGYGERAGALALLDEVGVRRGSTLGADKGYDTQDFVAALHERGVVPHIAQNTNGRRSAVPSKISRTEGYALSQRARKRVEQPFGWIKSFGGLNKLAVTLIAPVRACVTWTFSIYNLVRLGGLGGWWVAAPT